MIYIDTNDLIAAIVASENTDIEKEQCRQIILLCDEYTIEDTTEGLNITTALGESFVLRGVTANQLIYKEMKNPKNEALEAEEQETGY